MPIHLIANRWQTPDGTILQSKHRRDCVTYKDTNTGEFCLVDGGITYIRTAGSLKDLCITTEHPHEDQRKFFSWGSMGKEGDQPLKYVPLCEMTAEHIEAIMETQTHVPEYLRELFRNELEYRKAQE